MWHFSNDSRGEKTGIPMSRTRIGGTSKSSAHSQKRARTLTRAVCEGLEIRRLFTIPTPPPGYITPQAMQGAYGVNDISFDGITGNGAGQTIAIVDPGSDPTAYTDLQAFDTYFGLPDPPSFHRYDEHGGTNYPAVSTNVEEGLDIEWAHVIAPDAAIDVVEVNSFAASDIYSAGVVTAANLPGVSVVSMSFTDDSTGYDSIFTTPSGHNPVTFLAATGDDGANLNGNSPTSYPASSPNVVAVGGTEVNIGNSNNWVSETGWTGSGGGISNYETQPSYQAGKVNGLSSSQRTVPDVAMNSGYGVYVYDVTASGSTDPWSHPGGTSLATPMFGGLVAIANQGRAIAGLSTLNGASQTLPRLYSLPSTDFHDITSMQPGSTSTATSSNGNQGYAPLTGYDLVTGIGTPIANLLVPALALNSSDFSSSSFIVTNTNDSGVGSLRQAIIDADLDGQPETISFNIPSGYSSGGVFTIDPQTPLPMITDPSLTIDGRTETENNTSISNPNGGPVIYLNGSSQNIPGLTIAASGDVIANLGIDNFAGIGSGAGGVVLTGGANQDDIKGCYIGIAPNGTSAAGNGIGISIADAQNNSNTIDAGIGKTDPDVIGWNTIGISLSGGGGDTVDLADIGVTAPISGITYGGAAVPNGTGIIITSGGNTIENSIVDNSTGNGIFIFGGYAYSNVVEGSTIGVFYYPNTADLNYGYYPAPNGDDGILISNGADGNQIGGNTNIDSAYPNLIAGNTLNGIEIDGSSGTVIESNTIGEATHLAEVNNAEVSVNDPNGSNGIQLNSAATSNQIGGPVSTDANTLSGNGTFGLQIVDSASTGNTIESNYIGTDAAGDSIGNFYGGVALNSNTNIISYNVISGNEGTGLMVDGSGNTITENKVGTSPGGTTAVPNQIYGVFISGNSDQISSNIISGNDNAGLGVGGNSNTITLNDIGVNATGNAAMPNGAEGIYISGSGNTIGGASFAAAGNVISGNTAGNGYGIWLDGSTATANNINGNYIGTNSAGTAALANTDGIVIQGGANDNGVGGLSSGEGNLISGNTNDGVLITGASGSGLYGNTIGVYYLSTGVTTSGGYYPLPNGGDGVQITNGANSNEIGISTTDTDSENLIAGNIGNGVEIDDSSGNVVEANDIGQALYKQPLKAGGYIYVNDPNGGAGIYLNDAATNNTIGGPSVSTQGNLISGNDGSGIHVVDDASSGNTIEGNDIGIDTSGNSYANGGGLYIHGDSETITQNVISGNSYSGVNLAGISNTVSFNKIGTNLTGTAADGNAQQGVYVTGNFNVINENTISGNGQQGVMINGSLYNTISGNGIGMNSAYGAAIPNQLQGVLVTGTSNTVSGDVIGGNIGAGIDLEGNGNTVSYCYVGINTSGGAVSNGGEGVYIDSSANLIGGTSYATSGNVISGNTTGNGDGILLDTSSAIGNYVEGNYIGTNITGTLAVGNLNGVVVQNGASGNYIGVSNINEGNLISGNTDYGILVTTSATNNQINNNDIGTDYTGALPIGNSAGIGLEGTGSTIGGLATDQGNTIDFNTSAIYVQSGNAVIEGCTIYDNNGFGGGAIGIGGYFITTQADVTIYNCTLTDNSYNNAGGIDNIGYDDETEADVLSVYDSTITGNSGGIDEVVGTVFLENTIVAQNSGDDVYGAASGSYNLIGNATGMTGISNGAGGNQVGTSASPINPLLKPLANYGGNTSTLLPAANSPVLNAGIGLSFLSTDQRGAYRPTSGAVDIGAVQLNSLAISGPAIYLRLAADGQTLDIYYNNTGTGTPAFTYVLSNLATLTGTGTSGNDQLTIDYSNGVPIPSGTGFTYDGLAGTNTMKVIGTAGNDAISVQSTYFAVGSSTATYANVQTRIIDPLGGSDSVTIGGGLTVSFPGATPGGGIAVRNLSTLSLGSGSKLIVPTAASHSDRTLLVVKNATLGSSATIDLGGNDADFTGTPLATVANWVGTGFNGGSWTGSGISSSYAAGNTAQLTALGVIQNNQSGMPLFSSSRLFDSITPGTSDVLLKYTYYGDANLDGKIDGSDYSRIDSGYLQHLTGWYNGDFNYDGSVNGSDYTLIDNAFNTQGASMAASVSIATSIAAATVPTSTAGKDQLTPLSASRSETRVIEKETRFKSRTTPFAPRTFQTNAPIAFPESANESIELLMKKKDLLDVISSQGQ